MSEEYLSSAKKLFQYYRSLGEKTFEQLQDEQLFWQCNNESNSIATIVKHLSGNMLSRWTDFLTSDGEKDWRNRESEFENDIHSREELMKLWNQGWQSLFDALDALQPADLQKEVYIRNMGHVVVDAINRQLAHYPYHIGQIVFIGKMLCNEHWKSLSIPRGKSDEFNAAKFSEPKHKEHFTDEFLKK
jgi:Mor family transcriptional regulator